VRHDSLLLPLGRVFSFNREAHAKGMQNCIDARVRSRSFSMNARSVVSPSTWLCTSVPKTRRECAKKNERSIGVLRIGFPHEPGAQLSIGNDDFVGLPPVAEAIDATAAGM
jgi:hypothetical protein